MNVRLVTTRLLLATFFLLAATDRVSASHGAFFDIFIDLAEGVEAEVSGPPYPTNGVGLHVFHGNGFGDNPDDLCVLIGIESASDDGTGTGSPLPLHLRPRLGNVPPGGTRAIDSFFDITYLSSNPSSFPVDSFFDITFELAHANGGPTEVSQLQGAFRPDSFFDITYRVVGNIGSSGEDGVRFTMSGRLAPGLSFGSQTRATQSTNSFFDVFFDLHSDPLTLDLSNGLFSEFRMTAQFVPEPSSGLLLGGLMAVIGLAHRRRVVS